MEYFLVAVGDTKADAGTTSDAAVGTDPNYDKEGFNNSIKACRKMLDLACVTSQYGCPDQVVPSRKDYPYHDCAVAGVNCVLGASTCEAISECNYSTSQWPEDLAEICD